MLIPSAIRPLTARLKTLRVNHPGSWKPFAGEPDGVAAVLIAAIVARLGGRPQKAPETRHIPV